jgi:hypothetical protein
MATKADERREQKRRYESSVSLEGRDVAPIPDVIDPDRKAACERDFRQFCLQYFPWSFPLPFSQDHLKVIAKIETSVLEGGLFGVAMPRGSGKTTLSECACMWSLLYGHRSFVVLIGADEGAAARMLESIKVELETNDLLAEDFPEVCHPIARLERIANRCKGQLCDDEPTFIVWKSDMVALPTVNGSRASGGVAMIGGLTASIRGLKFKRPDGKAARPDLVVIDDPQTDESARSASQVAYRERVLSGAVLGMAGPGKKIAGVMPCTVIAPGDLADNLLDPKKHPEWRGERTKLIYSLPENEDLWRKYAEIRADSLRAERGGAEATEFYRANREAMDAGAVVAWPERYEPDTLSAVQYAMNLKIDRPEVFAAEYQNDPLPLVAEEPDALKPDAIAGRLSRIARGKAPGWAQRITAFVDVQQDLLYWCVCAFGEGFSGAVVDYGSWPDQRRPYFALADARPTISQATGIGSLEGSLWAALTALAEQLLGREWPVDGAAGLKVERCLVDSGWGLSTALVKRFCRQSAHAAVLTPSKGYGIGASASPIADWGKQTGERRGMNWILRPPKPGEGRMVIYDTNFWKGFLSARLNQPVGETGALTLFGADPAAHRMFCDHLCSEYKVRTTGRGRSVEEWKLKPSSENHLFDCVVGCYVGASMAGATLPNMEGRAPKRERTRVSFAEMQARARGMR